MSGVAEAVPCAKPMLVAIRKANEASKNKFAFDVGVGKVIFIELGIKVNIIWLLFYIVIIRLNTIIQILKTCYKNYQTEWLMITKINESNIVWKLNSKFIAANISQFLLEYFN